jgi:tetratricopeptide (TPR) repeat protein
MILLFVAVPGWKWNDLARSDSSYRYLCDLFKLYPKNAVGVWKGDQQIFSATYGMVAKGWRHDLKFMDDRVVKNGDYPKDGTCLYLSAEAPVPAPYVCHPWGLVYRVYDRSVENTLPTPIPPYWLPPHFTEAEKRDCESVGPHANLYFMEAVWYADHGEMAKAYQSLERSIEISPGAPAVYLKAGVEYGKWGDSANCEKYLKMAEEIQPQTYQILINLGLHYGMTAQWDLCRVYLYKALKSKPNDPVALSYIRKLEQQ